MHILGKNIPRERVAGVRASGERRPGMSQEQPGLREGGGWRGKSGRSQFRWAVSQAVIRIWDFTLNESRGHW
jgi:hypothetical protein